MTNPCLGLCMFELLFAHPSPETMRENCGVEGSDFIAIHLIVPCHELLPR